MKKFVAFVMAIAMVAAMFAVSASAEAGTVKIGVSGPLTGGAAVYGILKSGKAPETLTAEELDKIVSFACAAAGLSTTRYGGISSVPEYDEVMARITG